MAIPKRNCYRKNGVRGLSNKLENLLTFQPWLIIQSPGHVCFPHICQDSGFTRHFPMISNSLTAALWVRKSRNCSNFYIISIKQCFLIHKSLSPSEFFFSFFSPFETFSYEVLQARSMPIVASESLRLIGLPLRTSPAVCFFSAPNKCQTIRDGTGDV